MSSTNQGPRRVGQWLYLRPESIDEYKKCHAAVWPQVLEQIKDSNIRDCTSPALPSNQIRPDQTKPDQIQFDQRKPQANARACPICRLHLPDHAAAPHAIRQLQVRR